MPAMSGTKKPKTFLTPEEDKADYENELNDWIFGFIIFRLTTPPESLCFKFKITMRNF
jgi:hypothetical protein